MATARGANRRGARRAGASQALSRERIARAALALVDRDGLDAFSMRRLAEDLGVGTMTLYGYFRDRDDLLDTAVDVASQEVRIPSRRGSWKAQLRKLMQEVRRSLAAHPSGVRLRLARPMLSPGALRTTEAGMRILLDAGFSRKEAARAYRVLFTYTFGFASFSPPEASAEHRRLSQAALAALPPEQYPALSSAAAEAAASMGDEAVFDYGLDRLLDGLEAGRRQAAD